MCARDIAVFTFDSIDVSAGITIDVVGERSLALLSKTDAIIAGTIDVSAVNSDGIGGGGDGAVVFNTAGDAAAGAPSTGAGAAGGGGGAFGGDGDRSSIHHQRAQPLQSPRVSGAVVQLG